MTHFDFFLAADLPAAPAATMLLACAAAGLAAAALGWWVVWVLQSEDIAQGAEWRYDVSRINELRRAEPLYRFFQPILTLLGRFNRLLFPGSLPEIGRQIQAAGLTRFWLPEEYLGRAELVALLALPVYVYALSAAMGDFGLALAVAAVPLTAWQLRRRLASRAPPD